MHPAQGDSVNRSKPARSDVGQYCTICVLCNILPFGNYFADLQISGSRHWSVDNGHQVDASIVRGDLHKLFIVL